MRVALCTFLVLYLTLTSATAYNPDMERGKKVYRERCHWCHGEDGDAMIQAVDRMIPPPRAFTEGWYKLKTSDFDEVLPTDEDIYRVIADGMPGTVMSGWKDLLSDKEIKDVAFYIKSFSGYEKESPASSVDYGNVVEYSEESVKKGKELFLDRCAECHGETGKGVSMKKLKDDLGYRTWPRNLTKPWTFRGSNDGNAIFSRITVGIPGTQMPSFADPASRKKLTIEERWHVVNFVTSIAEREKVVSGENTVIKAEGLEGELPDSPVDEKWAQAESSTFYLFPQLIAKEPLFTPSNDTISARALYNEKEIAILLEWDDRTKSIPGNADAVSIADEEIYEDAVSIQWPVEMPDGMEKPYFGMGDAAHPVNLWQWKSGTAKMPESANLLNANGFDAIEMRDSGDVGLSGKGIYDNGTWRVVIKRPLITSDRAKDVQIIEGMFIPVAFAAWDGSNGENGSRHTMTTWYWVLLKPAHEAKIYIIPLLVMLVILGGELWWVKNAKKMSLD